MEEINQYKILKSMDILKNISDDTIREMALKSSIQVYNEEKMLFLEEEDIDSIYLIYKGKVMVSKFDDSGEEKIIYILDEGNFINDIALDRRKTSVSALVKKDSQIIQFKKEDVLNWMQKDFNFNLLLVHSLTSKLRRTYRQIKNLGLKKINSRISSKLWKLAKDYGFIADNHIFINLDITQTQLASMVGSTRESVSRFLKQLERENIIQQKNQRIIILDMDGLKKYL